MTITKKLRFKIFERDNFTCQYCGKKVPEVILEVDHIISRKDGGGDEELNLITSCFDCNRGKSATSVDIKKLKNTSFKAQEKVLKEKKAQLAAYYDFIKEKEEVENYELKIFEDWWETCSGDENSLTQIGLSNLSKLKQKYSDSMILEAIKIAWDSTHVDSDNKFKYMCGILKNLKLKEENPEEAENVKRVHQFINSLSYRINYCNPRMIWKWINDGMCIEDLEKEAKDFDRWTAFRDYIFNKYYE